MPEAPWAAVLSCVFAILFIGALIWLQRGWLHTGPNNDFLSFYTASETELYTATALADAGGRRPYLRLPFHSALLEPLRLLPYPSAYLLWQVLMLWCLVGFVAWWRPPAGWIALAGLAVSVPLFFTFVRGQDTAVLLLAGAASLRAATHNQHFRAGLWLSLLAIQPHALVATPLVLFAQRRWVTLKGLFAGLAAAGTLSFAVGGWGWPLRFAAAWQATEPATAAAMPNLSGAAAWLGLDPAIVYPASALILAAVYSVGCRESLPASLGCALAAGLLVAPRVHFEDTVLLLPAALTLLAERHSWPVRLLAGVALTPLPFVLQGGGDAVPAVVLLGVAMLCLAGLLPSEQSWTSRRRRLLVQLGLN